MYYRWHIHRKKSASLHYASFFDLDRGQVFQIFCIMLWDAIYRAGCKGNVLQHQNLFSCISSSPQLLPLSQPSLPPSCSPFSSVFPSFLIHFLCITPLLSTPIYSALPPPILHKHTLYFSLLPSVTLPHSFPPSLPPQFPLLLPFTLFIISLSLLWSRHLILSASFPLIFISF